MNFRFRLGLATLTTVATGRFTLKGFIKTGWIEAALVIRLASLVAQGSVARYLPNVIISITAISLSLTIFDLILRPTLGHRLHYTPTNFSPHRYPELPIVARWDHDQFPRWKVWRPGSYDRRPCATRTPAHRVPDGRIWLSQHPSVRTGERADFGDSFSAGTGRPMRTHFHVCWKAIMAFAPIIYPIPVDPMISSLLLLLNGRD